MACTWRGGGELEGVGQGRSRALTGLDGHGRFRLTFPIVPYILDHSSKRREQSNGRDRVVPPRAGVSPRGALPSRDVLRCRRPRRAHPRPCFDGRSPSRRSRTAWPSAGAVGFGFDVLDRGVAAAEALGAWTWSTPGFSMGVMPAQKLAQTRAGAAGRCSSTPACRSPSLAMLGPRVCQSRSMGWTLTRNSRAG